MQCGIIFQGVTTNNCRIIQALSFDHINVITRSLAYSATAFDNIRWIDYSTVGSYAGSDKAAAHAEQRALAWLGNGRANWTGRQAYPRADEARDWRRQSVAAYVKAGVALNAESRGVRPGGSDPAGLTPVLVSGSRTKPAAPGLFASIWRHGCMPRLSNDSSQASACRPHQPSAPPRRYRQPSLTAPARPARPCTSAS